MSKKPVVKPADIKNDISVPASLLASEILALSEGVRRLESTRLTRRALILLIQDMIGPGRIKKEQISAVLDALPDLATHYLKKDLR